MEEAPNISRFANVGRSVDARNGKNSRTQTTNGHNRHGSMKQAKRYGKQIEEQSFPTIKESHPAENSLTQQELEKEVLKFHGIT